MRETLPGTRREILELLSKQKLTSLELSERLKITPAGIRQHLAPLEALGWVEREREVQGAHRPSYRFRLTDQGQRAFPKRYDLLLGELLEVLLDRQGVEQAHWLVRQAARRLADRVRERVQGAGPAERWRKILDWLEAELSWRADVTVAEGGQQRLTIHQCPFQDVSAAHPEVCGAFCVTLIAELSGTPPGQHVPSAEGPSCCSILLERMPRES
jgi:predicted ArsR family transcriptional regulator